MDHIGSTFPPRGKILGQHWVADASGCDPRRFTEALIAAALREMPNYLGLTRVSEPALHAHADGTLAGVVLIAESHMSLHCFPQSGDLHVDIFSCAPFSIEHAKQELQDRFGVQQFSETLIERNSVG
jgi:S-adenosylmethionine decarboxylase